jgi:hypothetical protein
MLTCAWPCCRRAASSRLIVAELVKLLLQQVDQQRPNMPTCVKCGSLAWAVLLQWQNKHGQGQIKARAVGTLMAHESCTLQPLFRTVLSGTCCTCNHHLR